MFVNFPLFAFLCYFFFRVAVLDTAMKFVACARLHLGLTVARGIAWISHGLTCIALSSPSSQVYQLKSFQSAVCSLPMTDNAFNR